MERGTALEPYLVDVAERVAGMKVVERNLRCIHPLAPHVQAQLDARFEDGTLLEIKTAASDDGWGDGPDALPEHYRCQNQQQMLVAKAPKTIVFAAIGAAALKMLKLAIEHAVEAAKEIVGKVWEKEGRVYTVHGEEAFQSMLYFRLDGFWWDHVVADVPPVATSIEDVRKLWPEQSTRIMACGTSAR